MPPPPPPPPYEPGTPEFASWAAEDKGSTVLILCWFFVALATVFMIGRLYARIHLHHGLRSDDYWCLASVFFAYMASAFTSVAVDYGHGKHVQTLSQHQAEQVRLWTFAAFMPGVLVLGLPKVAVVTLLNRLLNPSKWHRRFLWGMVIWCLLSNLATIGTLAGQCTPTRAMWNFDMVPTCVNPDHIIGFSIYSGAYNAFVDIYLAVYPAIVLFKLQMKMKKKIVLSLALGIGAVGGAVAIYKTTRLPDGLGSPDFSYDSVDLVYWSIIEASTIIIAATIPTLSPLMEKLFKGRNPFTSFRGSSKGTSKGGSKGSSKGGSQGGSKQHQSHGRYSHSSYTDPFAPQRKIRDPDSLSMDFAETIAVDSSEDFLPIQKAKEGDLEAQNSHDAPRPSDSTEVPMQEHWDQPGIIRTDVVSVSHAPRDPNTHYNNSGLPQ